MQTENSNRFHDPTSIGEGLQNEAKCLSVRLSVCRVHQLNSKMERHRKPKIGRMEAHQTSN